MSSGLLALLALAVVAGARQPQRDVLATATTEPGAPGTTTSTTAAVPVPPVQLPTPSARETREPASVSGSLMKLGVPSVGSIPEPALTAYQRAAAVIDAADATCHLDWTLLAAIGQVESDQGRFAGSQLDSQGVATPGILGPRLDGTHGVSSIRDTDAGKLDGDRRFDRAVGPMQFLPSTWAAVAVDGDNDGRRDPQDIDDAALGAAVYLCADDNDLATNAGAKAALYRYNHSDAYVARVMAIARSLRASGVFTAITAGTVTSATTTPITRGGNLPIIVSTSSPSPGRPGHHHSSPGTPPVHWWADPPGPVVHDPAPPTDPSSPGNSPTPPTDPTPPTGPPTGPPTDPTPPTDPPTDPTPPTDPPTDPTPPGDPTPPTDPTPPAEPPVLTDPLPAELADLTAEQVDAYNTAWATCDDTLTAGWSTDPGARDALTQCLATEIAVPADDAQLLTFVDWLGRTEDAATP